MGKLKNSTNEENSHKYELAKIIDVSLTCSCGVLSWIHKQLYKRLPKGKLLSSYSSMVCINHL
jgi:hypothetical protein